MNDKLAELMLIELKKTNEYLERLDWKLWNIHKKYIDDDRSVEAVRKQIADVSSGEAVQQPATSNAPPASSAPVKSLSPVADNFELPPIPKYPSLER